MSAPHLWCQILGIAPPRLELVKDHPEANTFALFLVALLERQSLMTLAEVAERFEAAGIAPRAKALTSLQRCRPARPPAFREGDRYGLDPYDDDLDLRTFMLGLRPPRHAATATPASPAMPDQRANRRAVHAGLTRAVLVTFPPEKPVAAALIDVNAHQLATFVGDAELARLRDQIGRFDVIAGLEVRAALRALEIEPSAQRLAELSSPIRTRHITATEQVFSVTPAILITSSCGLPDPLNHPARLAALVDAQDHAGLRERLAADAHALLALYRYGRLHGLLRLRHGGVDEMLPAPWAHGDEEKLAHLMQTALDMKVPLEVVAGRTPAWDDPWGRAQAVHVVALDRWHQPS